MPGDSPYRLSDEVQVEAFGAVRLEPAGTLVDNRTRGHVEGDVVQPDAVAVVRARIW